MILKSGIVEKIFEYNSPGPWHYAVLDSHCQLYLTVADWCLDNFGVDGFHNWVTSVDKSAYFFQKKEDLILFILRWS